MSNFNKYDRTNPESIEKYSQSLIGKTFREVIDESEINHHEMIREFKYYGPTDVKEKKRNKGNLGQIIEENFFRYKCNSDSRPDFHEAGVELKVSPYKINKNKSKSAKERLILTMIDYHKVVNEVFEDSHLWNKSRLILLIYYLYEQEITSNLDYRIDFSKLFTPPEQDLAIIKHDFEIITSKIREGKAHELSEGDTMYLGAATKSGTSSNRRTQPFSDILAKPRAFSFKTSYMTHVLNNYIIPGKKTYEPIIVDGVVDLFEEYVVSKISENKDKSVEELCLEYGIEYENKPKQLESMIAYRILGIKGNKEEEFIKANIVMKTIRVEKSNKIKESMSFPTFKFKELIKEKWEDSTFGNYLRETRFLFVVYKYDKDNILRLKGCQFWNIPYKDLEEDVKNVWERTKAVILEGLKIEIINGKKHSNLPKESENRVSHVRPHGKNSEDTYELPDGRKFPKQCFWLNKKYIYNQLNDKLKY